MIKPAVFLSLNIFISFSLLAQVKTLGDSISIFEGTRLKSIIAEDYTTVSDSMYFYAQTQNRIDWLQKNGLTLLTDSTLQTGIFSLYYNRSKGRLGVPLNAYLRQTAGLYTEGVKSIGKGKILGKFNFNREWEDSLSGRLGHNIENEAYPYYYFTPKAGVYERQNFNMEVHSYFPINKKWYITGGLQYRYHWTAGTVDPRADNKYFQLKVLPGIAYSLPKAIIGVTLLYGKEDETTGLIYKSRTFSESQLYPERAFYLNYGYGYISLKDQRVYKREVRNRGISILLQHRISNWQTSHLASYEQTHSNYLAKEDHIETRNSAGSYIHNNYTLSSIAQKSSNTIRQQLLLTANLSMGSDFNKLLNGTNYTFDSKKVSLKYLQHFHAHRSLNMEPAIHIGMGSIEKSDAAAAHVLQASYMILAPGINLYRFNNKKHKLYFGYQLQIYWPLKSKLQYSPTQKNSFTENIALKEHSFYKSKNLENHFRCQYILPEYFRQIGISFLCEVLVANSKQRLYRNTFKTGVQLLL